MDYMKRVDHDWGGQDRLDHVHAMTEVLPADDRVDVARAARHRTLLRRIHDADARRPASRALVGGGRHVRAVRPADVHGPDPADLEAVLRARDRPSRAATADFLVERSPKTYLGDVTCPMLVIQGKNDPRVVEQESADVVESLRADGKDVDYLVFEDEGHDVLKLPNKIRCYDTIVQFFHTHLGS